MTRVRAEIQIRLRARHPLLIHLEHVDLLEAVEQFLEEVSHILVLFDPHVFLLNDAALKREETGFIDGLRLDQDALPVLIFVLQVVRLYLQLI